MKRRIISFSITVFIIVVTAALIIGLAFAIYVAATMESEIDESLFEVLGGHTASKIYYYESDGKRDVGEATELEDQELYGGYRSLPLKYEEVPSDFHPRYSAHKKRYVYKIHASKIRNPFYEGFA